jgi:hypothetical protein
VAKVRKIERMPPGGAKNYYLVDACFLANKHIPATYAPAGTDRSRVEQCQDWWKEIDAQLAAGKARVYVPDICIAEAFKVLAKKYHSKNATEKWFPTFTVLKIAKQLLAMDLTTPRSKLVAASRKILYHDISTNRDIVISVDRFYELFMTHGKNVGVIDLILAATAKYLLDFFDIPFNRLHIVTLDNALREGIAKVGELPAPYDPTKKLNYASTVFK